MLAPGEHALKIGYQGQQAIMKDNRRDFELAAWEYYRTSNMGSIEGADMVDLFLKPALRAAILTPAGDRKFAVLAQLYKDERSKTVTPHFAILERFYFNHIIKWEEMVPFQQNYLEEHQRATDSDGYSCLFKATLEHNIQVLSKIYLNISFA